MSTTAAARDALVRAAELRVLNAALWSRSDAEHARAVLPSDAFAGRPAVLWALVAHHDARRPPTVPAFGPQPSDAEPYTGPGRVLSIWRTARDSDAPDYAPVFRVAVVEHGIPLVAIAPDRGWRVELDDALDVLAIAAAHRAAAQHTATLDELVQRIAATPRATRSTTDADTGARAVV